jgi:hypothetical protein
MNANELPSDFLSEQQAHREAGHAPPVPRSWAEIGGSDLGSGRERRPRQSRLRTAAKRFSAGFDFRILDSNSRVPASAIPNGSKPPVKIVCPLPKNFPVYEVWGPFRKGPGRIEHLTFRGLIQHGLISWLPPE